MDFLIWSLKKVWENLGNKFLNSENNTNKKDIVYNILGII